MGMFGKFFGGEKKELTPDSYSHVANPQGVGELSTPDFENVDTEQEIARLEKEIKEKQESGDFEGANISQQILDNLKSSQKK